MVGVPIGDDAVREATLSLLTEAGIPALGLPALDGGKAIPACHLSCIVLFVSGRAQGLLAQLAPRVAGLPAVLLAPGPVEARQAMEALDAGIGRLLEMPGEAEQLPQAVLALAGGGRPAPAPGRALTMQEDEVLCRLLAGTELRRIALTMRLPYPALLRVRRAAIRALGAEDLPGALRNARERGLRAAA